MKLSNCSPRTLLEGLLLLLLPGALLGARPVTLTFQEAGMPDSGLLGNFYNGGGGPTVNYSIAFSNNCDTHEDEGYGQRYMYVYGTPNFVVVDVAGGFTGSFSFLYLSSTAINPGTALANVYDGPCGTGKLLASKVLPQVYEWTVMPMPFGGTAKSVLFSGYYYPEYDNQPA